MKHMRTIALTALAVAALTALLGAGSASATTLEVSGVKQAGSVALNVSLGPTGSATLRDTFGFSVNTCTTSNLSGTTNVATGATVTGPLSTLSFSKCTSEPVVVHKAGTFHIAHTSGTDGTVSSSGAEFTLSSPFGTLTCVTGAGTHLGVLQGGSGVFGVNAVLSCSGISMRWVGGYVMTSPSKPGVVA